MRLKYTVVLVILATINYALCQSYIAANQSRANLELVANAVTDLAQKISSAIVDPKSKTEIFSPVSIAGALSLLLLGANGATKTELMRLMGFQNQPINFTEIHKSFAALFAELVSNTPTIQTPIPWRETDRCSNYDSDDDFENRGSFQKNNPAQQQRTTRDAENNVEISIGNGIFTKEGTTFDARFAMLAKTLYSSELEYLDFKQKAQKSVNTINEWVRTRTKGKIPQIVSQLDPNTLMVIANTLYFKADWQAPFLKDGTRPRKFFPNGPNQPSKDVPMMVHSGCFPYYNWEQANVQVIGFPYNKNITMYVFMPNDSDMYKVRALHSKMSAAIINDIIGRMQVKTVAIQFPKMRLQSSFSMKDILQQLGVYTMFDHDRSELYRILEDYHKRVDGNANADDIFDVLSDTVENAILQLKANNTNCKRHYTKEVETKSKCLESDRCVYGGNTCVCCLGRVNQRRQRAAGEQPKKADPLYVDEVIHKVNLVMDEQGTEGAAVTATLIDRIGSQLNYRANGPFLLFIRDETTKLPLFYGSVYDPTL